ncbi:MAG: LysR family transcriptional regulator, partial [Bacteroidota bacterium]
MIEIKHLRLIQTIAEVGSMSKAARALHLTQSALSHQLRQLEDHLGLPVFYRRKGQLHFTPAGKEFSEMSKDILANLSQLESRITEIKEQHLSDYIHGYSQREMDRLYEQSLTIADILHWDSYWDPGTKVLEAGCGVGGQTRIIAPQNPEVAFVSVDISRKSIEEAERRLAKEDIPNVRFQVADILDLPFPDKYFDHLFICFVLEHLKQP